MGGADRKAGRLMPRQLVTDHSIARQLNTAGAGMLSLAARDTLLGLVETQFRGGYNGRDDVMQRYGQARAELASFVNARPDEISFQPSVSAIVSLIAESVALAPGDEVLSWATEYPSNIQAWQERTRACSARLVLAGIEPGACLSQLAEFITPRTRVVAVSSIQSLDGAVADLATLRSACDRVGALLLLDVSQHLGIAPFDFAASGANFAYGVSHKWLLGPPGIGILMARQTSQPLLRTQVFGTHNYQGQAGRHFDPQRRLRDDIGRLEGGTPPLMAAIATAASARALQQVGVAAIQQQALAARAAIAEVFASHGHQALDTGHAPHSPIITLQLAAERLAMLMPKLTATGVQFIERGGLLRFSPWAMSADETAEMAGLLEQACSA